MGVLGPDLTSRRLPVRRSVARHNTSANSRFQQGGSDSDMFELAARGPHGAMTFRSDSASDVEASTEFLRDNVWGDAVPPHSEVPAL
jgi:hypothetical protein